MVMSAGVVDIADVMNAGGQTTELPDLNNASYEIAWVPDTIIHSVIHSFIHSFIHSVIQSFIHSLLLVTGWHDLCQQSVYYY